MIKLIEFSGSKSLPPGWWHQLISSRSSHISFVETKTLAIESKKCLAKTKAMDSKPKLTENNVETLQYRVTD